MPIQNPTVMQDQRVSSLIQYAMKVENIMFETASSREEYYKLLAEKIYSIRKELEDRKRSKLEMEGRQVPADAAGLGQGLCQGPTGAPLPFPSQPAGEITFM